MQPRTDRFGVILENASEVFAVNDGLASMRNLFGLDSLRHIDSMMAHVITAADSMPSLARALAACGTVLPGIVIPLDRLQTEIASMAISVLAQATEDPMVRSEAEEMLYTISSTAQMSYALVTTGQE
jgi:hypothetical protein